MFYDIFEIIYQSVKNITIVQIYSICPYRKKTNGGKRFGKAQNHGTYIKEIFIIWHYIVGTIRRLF